MCNNCGLIRTIAMDQAYAGIYPYSKSLAHKAFHTAGKLSVIHHKPAKKYVFYPTQTFRVL